MYIEGYLFMLKKMGSMMYTKFFWIRISSVCRLCWKWHEGSSIFTKLMAINFSRRS